MSLSRRWRRDDGAVLVLSAMLMLALVVMVGLVVDLGLQRYTRQEAKSVADAAALAAGPELADLHLSAACAAAWASIVANVSDLPATATSPCSGFPAACSATTSPATYTASGTDPYTISVRYPVASADITDGRRAGGAGAEDGSLCQRLMVSVTKVNQTSFGAAAGIDELSATGRSVVRSAAGTSQQAPALWLLDPVGCAGLSIQGGARVSVGTTSPLVPGLVTIDSDASACTGQQVTLDVGGSGSSLAAVPTSGTTPGEVSLFAQAVGAATCANRACDPTDVTGGLLSPAPVGRTTRATRAPVDYKFDCRSSYQAYMGVSIAGCPASGTTRPYISDLVSVVGAGMPTGWTNWTTVSGQDCTPNTNLAYNTNVFVNCSTFKPGQGVSATFTGNVVFTGSVDLQSSSTLRINGANPQSALLPGCLTAVCRDRSSATAAFVYQRAGALKVQGANLHLTNVAWVQSSSGQGIDLGGNQSTVRWSAPTEGPFSGLALWAEAVSGGNVSYSFSSGGAMVLSGTFFTPNGLFTLAGNSSSDVRQAQFIAYRGVVTGGASLVMSPNPINAVTLPAVAPMLIR